ncbi:hypothetical protein BCR34DRAFT_166933 [Clohesyomyces aquaticus]|uniref:Uncharacterized protein n=1 Tax=Clohesyomyces aquaticus TaxID=1231657 RepID=A0A1Y1YHA6_9PLEO|nr:hypothetical protein BCR34DRAFT_166933 [Clohesyomyces aquaticus]
MDLTRHSIFISCKKAYSLFLMATIVDKVAYPCKPLYVNGAQTSRVVEMLRIADTDGYKTPNVHWATFLPNLHHPSIRHLQGTWQFGDKHSWVMDLESGGVAPSAIADIVLDCPAFEIGAVTDPTTGFQYYKISFAPLATCSVKYEYTCPERNAPALRRMLIARTMTQLPRMGKQPP